MQQPTRTESDENGQAARRMQLQVMATFMKAGNHIDYASSVFLLGAFILLLGDFGFVALLLSMAVAFVEKYYACRVALDARLFDLLGADPEQAVIFDATLAVCSNRPISIPPRSVKSRWQGARSLLLRQALAFLFQTVCCLFAIVAR